MIRTVKVADARDICNIYNHYVTKTTITFEEEPVVLRDMESRISEISERLPWIVFEENEQILGYSYATSWKSRGAYRYSVESTVYISPLLLIKNSLIVIEDMTPEDVLGNR